MQKFLRLPDVITKTGRSRSSIYADIKDDKFPSPVSLGERAVGWLESEVDSWMDNKIESRPKQ